MEVKLQQQLPAQTGQAMSRALGKKFPKAQAAFLSIQDCWRAQTAPTIRWVEGNIVDIIAVPIPIVLQQLEAWIF